ncbi:MAG: ribose-5-phosphate isomerase [Spartobacteria bacterium AMD-G4]|jgi:ribose 5-phosphate isomerase B|nr:MAG: ribose-5-phosphate isomerase [Spartobacteria bacterium AMD-G4]
MKISIGSDHAGFEYKEAIIAHLKKAGHEVVDYGTDSSESTDYPLFIIPAAEAVVRKETERAIVVGGSGNGEAIAANKVKGIRCALCWSHETAEFGRRHNNANALSIGQRMIPLELALEIVDIWLATPFDGGRHARRVAELDCYEAGGGHSGMLAVFERKTNL